MMTALPKPSPLPPRNRWLGYICLNPLEISIVVAYLPRYLPIRRLIQITAAKAARKAKELNESPGTL